MESDPLATSSAVAAENASTRNLHFGDFVFDTATSSLARDGRRVPLRPQAAQALSLLLAKPGEAVGRDRLREVLWGRDRYVDFETGLNTCIRRLRQALDDDAADPRFVQTLPGYGYRFIAPVTTAPEENHRGALASGPPERETNSVGTSMPRRRYRPFAWFAGLLASGLASTLLWSMAPKRGLEPERPPAWTIVLGTFEAPLAGEQLGWALAEAFRIGLSQSDRLIVVPENRVRDTLARMTVDTDSAIDRQLGLEVARRLGADGLVVARALRFGDVWQLESEFLASDVGDVRVVSKARATSESGLLLALDRLIEQLHESTGTTATRPEGAKPLAEVTTANLEALRAYSAASRRIAEGDSQSAIALVERALEIDPSFAMARARLGVLYRNSGDYQRAMEQFDLASRVEGRLGSFERLYVDGWLATLRGDIEGTIRAWTLVKELHPDVGTGYHNLGRALAQFEGDYARCVDSLRDGLGMVAGRFEDELLRTTLALCQIGAGYPKDALTTAAALHPDNLRPDFSDLALLTLQRYDEAIDRTRSWEGRDGWSPADIEYIRAFGLADQGDFVGAAEAAKRSEIVWRASPHVQYRLAALLDHLVYLEAAGDPEAIDLAITKVASLFDSTSDLPWSRWRIRIAAQLGAIAARNRRMPLARQLFLAFDPGALRAHPEEGHYAALSAEILRVDQGLDAAADSLSQSLSRARVYPLYARERLASWLHSLGRSSEARQHDRWIVARRGRAFVECLGLSLCTDRAANVVAWGRADSRLGGVELSPATRPRG